MTGTMASKRTHSAPFALALDGSLLLNVSGQLDATLISRLAEALSSVPGDVFVGTRLPPAQRAEALNRFDDAAAEAAARLQGSGARSGTQSSSRSRSLKTYKKV
jgi:hypothetical protein